MKKPETAGITMEKHRMEQAALIAAGHLMQGTYRPDDVAQSKRLVRLARQIIEVWDAPAPEPVEE